MADREIPFQMGSAPFAEGERLGNVLRRLLGLSDDQSYGYAQKVPSPSMSTFQMLGSIGPSDGVLAMAWLQSTDRRPEYAEP